MPWLQSQGLPHSEKDRAALSNGSVRSVAKESISSNGKDKDASHTTITVKEILADPTPPASPPQVPQCPVAQKPLSAEAEHERIIQRCPMLASTGCTPQICQSGRMLHTDEPRVGENRDILNVLEEAQAFLSEMLEEGLFKTVDEFQTRLTEATNEIYANSRLATIRATGKQGLCGGHYHQTRQELEFGLRRSWRNARKCIMRSEHENLALLDLRHVTSSPDMATKIIEGMKDAFNGGVIRPTAIVLPPRTIDSRGPMIISQQLFAFAGYEQEDGSILGDPANAQLTKDIIDMGWEPPMKQTRWDLLPFVAMAENDAPAIVELPPELRRLVEIRHPAYAAAFETLDLKWVAAPALSRFGFDIGGVQYTASPFIGWFMEAEIGTRNLADTFRYNVLPDIVKAMKMRTGSGELVQDLNDVADFERLALLSRAQTELNYAVHYSFKQAGVSMIDSMSASANYCEYDDKFQEKHGYRLPADPYWLAPPQGSIIPIWHRGGAPNYQPKPLIAKHVQDPVKAWRREVEQYKTSGRPVPEIVIQRYDAPSLPNFNAEPAIATPKIKQVLVPELGLAVQVLVTDDHVGTLQPREFYNISIHYCTSGTTAKKLAERLHRKLSARLHTKFKSLLSPKVTSLDAVDVEKLGSTNLLLLVISSTGQGEIPPNGQAFYDSCKRSVDAGRKLDFKHAIFANGDSRYPESFIGAPLKITDLLGKLGTKIFGPGLWTADVCLEPMPVKSLDAWMGSLAQAMEGKSVHPQPSLVVRAEYDSGIFNGLGDQRLSAAQRRISEQLRLLSTEFVAANVVDVHPSLAPRSGGTQLVRIDLGSAQSIELGCVQIIPVNSAPKVERVLHMLGLVGEASVDLGLDLGLTPIFNQRFFAELVDLEAPFQNLEWLISDRPVTGMQARKLSPSSSVFDVLTSLHAQGDLKDMAARSRRAMLLAMPPLSPRTYSIASSAQQTVTSTDAAQSINIDIMVKHIPGGRFSHHFLASSSLPMRLMARPIEAACTQQLLDWKADVPLIAISTGAGFGPVRALLQRRATMRSAGNGLAKISIFAGMKPADEALINEAIDQAKHAGAIDEAVTVVSNAGKIRIQHRFMRFKEDLRRKILDESALVFICSGNKHAAGILKKLDLVLGVSARQVLGERLIMEIF